MTFLLQPLEFYKISSEYCEAIKFKMTDREQPNLKRNLMLIQITETIRLIQNVFGKIQLVH